MRSTSANRQRRRTADKIRRLDRSWKRSFRHFSTRKRTHFTGFTTCVQGRSCVSRVYVPGVDSATRTGGNDGAGGSRNDSSLPQVLQTQGAPIPVTMAPEDVFMLASDGRPQALRRHFLRSCRSVVLGSTGLSSWSMPPATRHPGNLGRRSERGSETPWAIKALGIHRYNHVSPPPTRRHPLDLPLQRTHDARPSAASSGVCGDGPQQDRRSAAWSPPSGAPTPTLRGSSRKETLKQVTCC
jgi:hypothetical protein